MSARYALPFDDRCDLHLSILEAPFRPHPAVRKAIRDVLAKEPLSRYPLTDSAPQKKLRRQIADYLALPRDIAPDDHILLTNGSDNALRLIVEQFVHGHRDVLVPWPTYPHMVKFLRGMKIKKLTVSYFPDRPEEPNGVALKLARELGGKTDYSMVYICSPNLPFGYRVSAEDINQLASLSPSTLFLVDQAYEEFASDYVTDGADMAKFACAAKGENIVVVRSFSKAFALASLRIGYMVAHRRFLERVRSLWNEKNVISLAVAAASASLEHLDYYRARWTIVCETKRYFHHALKGAYSGGALDGHLDYEIVGSSSYFGNWILLYARRPDLAVERLASLGIEARNKHDDVPHAIRIAVGTHAQMKRVVHAVKLINLHYLMTKERGGSILIDLDNTLREGSRAGGRPLSGAVNFVERHVARVVVCSNNAAYTPREIVDDLREAGFSRELSVEQICTPLTRAAQIAQCGRAFAACPLVIAARDELAQFVIPSYDSDYDYAVGDYTCAFLLTANADRIGAHEMLALSVLARQHRPIFYSYDEQCCPLESAADWEHDHEIVAGLMRVLAVPEVGTVVDFLVNHAGGDRRMMVPLGKPNAKMALKHVKVNGFAREPAVMIGDSAKSDGGLARALKVPFVHFGGDQASANDDFTLCVSSLEELLPL